jgi:hypothetical protein
MIMIIASHGDSAARGPNGHRPFAECPLCADTVAKVFLRDVTQVLRAVGAAIEK